MLLLSDSPAVCDDPDLTARYYILGPKLRASYPARR